MTRPITTEEFEQLYRSTAAELFVYFRRRAVADVEDLVAEVFATAWRRRDDLPATMLRRAWLYGTARNILLAEARRAGQEHGAVEQLAAQTSDAPTAAPNEIGEVVRAALRRLSLRDREVIELVEWERLTPAELAVALDIRPGNARVRLHRARKALAADPAIRELGHLLAEPGDAAAHPVTTRTPQ